MLLILNLKYSIRRRHRRRLHIASFFPLLILVATCDTLPAFAARLDDFGNEPSSPDVDSSSSATGGLVWQPLRATFRPLNRQQPPPPVGGSGRASFASPSPSPASSSSLTDSLALASSIGRDFDAFSAGRLGGPSSSAGFFPSSSSTTTPAPPITSDPAAETAVASDTTPPPIPPTTPAPASLRDIGSNSDDEEQPTRVPLNRFRPTKPPSVDPQSQPSGNPVNHLLAASGSHSPLNQTTGHHQNYRITSECFECICEASTNCNPNSRCQTSDVRHTRCGLFLISYDQWLETGLSRQLVTREALARDAAADERAFYECVTDRDCSERLMAIYMQRQARDCDKDGRVDCYDVAAIHLGGPDQCNGETLLDSQYWSDFNACFGFGR